MWVHDPQHGRAHEDPGEDLAYHDRHEAAFGDPQQGPPEARQDDHGEPRRLLAKRRDFDRRRSGRYALIPEHGNQTLPRLRGRTGPTGG